MTFATVSELEDFADGDKQLALELASAAVEAAAKLVHATIELLEDEEHVLDGQGTSVVNLPTWPVVEVTSVEVDGEPVTDFTWSRNGVLERTSGVWPSGRRNISTVATYGFADIPEAVRAVTLQVALEAQTNPSSLNSFSDGQVSAGFGGGGTGAEVLVLTNRQREMVVRAIR